MTMGRKNRGGGECSRQSPDALRPPARASGSQRPLKPGSWTKGQWHADPYGVWVAHPLGYQGRRTIFHPGDDWNLADEWAANAAVAAAAPQMAEYIRRKAEEGDREALFLWTLATTERSVQEENPYDPLPARST